MEPNSEQMYYLLPKVRLDKNEASTVRRRAWGAGGGSLRGVRKRASSALVTSGKSSQCSQSPTDTAEGQDDRFQYKP